MSEGKRVWGKGIPVCKICGGFLHPYDKNCEKCGVEIKMKAINIDYCAWCLEIKEVYAWKEGGLDGEKEQHQAICKDCYKANFNNADDEEIETASHHIHVDFPPEGGVKIIDVDCIFETVILNMIDHIERILRMTKAVPLSSLEDAESYYRNELKEILDMCKLFEVKP